MFKRTPRSRLDAVARSKRRKLRQDRLVESKKDKLPDEEFIKSSERKAFHRALKKEGRKARGGGSSRWNVVSG